MCICVHVCVDVCLGAGRLDKIRHHLMCVCVCVYVCVKCYVCVDAARLDKIRHHLMPLYNFDPTDEEPHWEQDLMEDDREQQIALNVRTHTLTHTLT